MATLNSLIQVYDNVLEENVCDFLINLFEQVPEKQQRVDNERRPNFTQFNLTENCNLNGDVKQVHNHLIQKTFDYRNQYYEMVDSRVFPEQHAFEQFRIKRYNNDGNDLFNTHVDVSDYETSRRFLSFMWYLNDVEVGGETRFVDMMIKPKKGNLLVFPPLWMFPHAGLIPISSPKYIISTYLHYK
jgi:hypothetical protein